MTKQTELPSTVPQLLIQTQLWSDLSEQYEGFPAAGRCAYTHSHGWIYSRIIDKGVFFELSVSMSINNFASVSDACLDIILGVCGGMFADMGVTCHLPTNGEKSGLILQYRWYMPDEVRGLVAPVTLKEQCVLLLKDIEEPCGYFIGPIYDFLSGKSDDHSFIDQISEIVTAIDYEEGVTQ